MPSAPSAHLASGRYGSRHIRAGWVARRCLVQGNSQSIMSDREMTVESWTYEKCGCGGAIRPVSLLLLEGDWKSARLALTPARTARRGPHRASTARPPRRSITSSERISSRPADRSSNRATIHQSLTPPISQSIEINRHPSINNDILDQSIDKSCN